ncbi:hypothetical protein LXA43DRAFT_1095058 [Ganoderma leucocontextum]|nr:hypothetical protein LXA43DRAFT_1095058 [Ganoderma leucocontextum]
MEMILLPSELLVKILIDLDFQNLLRCREVCTRFKNAIDEDLRVQYKLELAIAGMKDGPPSALTTAERLSILRTHQDAWNKFAWTAKEDVRMHKGDVWELHGNVLAQSEGNRTLHFKQIPSAIRRIEGTEWVIPDVGCDFTEIGMDPAQDLLIVIEEFWDRSQLTCRIHLRALSTGAPHPGPIMAMLTHKPKPGGYSYAIQISEEYLGIVMMCENNKELLIWEWKVGTLRWHITGPDLLSWAFLTSRFLLITHGGSEFDEDNTTIREPGRPHFVVIDLESLPSSNPVTLSEVDCVCAFHYPPLEDNIEVLDVLIQCYPGPDWCPSPALSIPFSVSCEDRLFVITLWVIADDDEIGVLLLVPASTFLRALATLAPGETRRKFAWAEWGPRGSRLMREPRMDMSMEVRYVYGTTFVTAEADLDTRAQRLREFVVARDFNQLAIRRAVGGAGGKDSGDEWQDVRVVTDTTVFEPAGVFQEEVTTALPYIQRVIVPFQPTEEDGEFNAVMLAEDALVLMSSTWQSWFRCRILSF